MMRRLMTIVIMLLMLSLCYYFNQVVDDIKESNIMTRARKKDGGNAYQNDKYKEGTYEAIKDVSKRPVNKKIQFEGMELIISENTYINDKSGNMVDLKTGYGLPITFLNKSACTKKKVRENVYYGILYNEKIPGVEELAQKIIKANGFVNICK